MATPSISSATMTGLGVGQYCALSSAAADTPGKLVTDPEMEKILPANRKLARRQG